MKFLNKNVDIPKEIKNQVKNFIEIGKKAEEKNNLVEAIKNYEEALSLIVVNEGDNRIFEMNIRLGEVHQQIGNIEDSLKNFKNAYDNAVMLGNKFYQVDALIKIAHNYLCKREVEEGIKFAESANLILQDIDYIQGKLEASIYWAWLYYIRKEHYKAREICNEALRICGDEYLIHKGKILNTLVELYKEMTSVDEHLKLLQQAYDCFEKSNYKRGMLGVANNIAAVYVEKLQDYKSALEYYEKLKELCESNGYAEFIVITYINLGEMHYRLLNYEEALYYFTEALTKPDGPFVENPILYINSYLCMISLKLNQYEEAHKYFIDAEKEFNLYSHREATLVNYYMAGASLYNELGEFEKAKSYIKQAIDIVEGNEAITKWDVGLLYEQIKLKEVKSNTEALDILSSVTFMLSKYKNRDEILDIAYSIAINIINKGYKELAFKFIEQFKHLKPSNKRVKLKSEYIRMARS